MAQLARCAIVVLLIAWDLKNGEATSLQYGHLKKYVLKKPEISFRRIFCKIKH
jgi:hypothetical protein